MRARAEDRPAVFVALATDAAVRATRLLSVRIPLLVVETVVARAGTLEVLLRRVATTRLHRWVRVLDKARVPAVEAVAVVVVVAPVGAVVTPFRAVFPLLWTPLRVRAVFPPLWTLPVLRFDRV
jgi:hypothetical protein